MNLEKLSASSYKTHSACPIKYFIQQNLKWYLPAGKAADRGTIAHRVLEILAEQKLARQHLDMYFATAETGEIGACEDIPVEELTRDVFDYLTTNTMTHHEWEEADFKECLKFVKTAITHSDGRFDPRNRKIISTEQYIRIIPKEDWAILPNGKKLALTGFIDLVTDEGDDVIEILDWKTAKRQTDFNTGIELNEITLRDDIQLKLYHYAATEIYGTDKTILVTIFFLNTKCPITILFTPDDLENTKECIRKKMNTILNTTSPDQCRSWKCTKFCEFGKNTFQDVSDKIAPLRQPMENGIAKQGALMTICDQVHYELGRSGIDFVERNLRFVEDDK